MSDHPEDFCEKCGERNVTGFAPSDLWNLATESDGGSRGVIWCPVCFVQAAERVGIKPTAWRIAPEDEFGRLTSSLADAEKARDRFQWLSQNADAIRQSMFDTGAENDKLRAALKDAERDTARLDWLEAQGEVFGRWVDYECVHGFEWRKSFTPDTPLREAIDAAIAEHPTQEQADR